LLDNIVAQFDSNFKFKNFPMRNTYG